MDDAAQGRCGDDTSTAGDVETNPGPGGKYCSGEEEVVQQGVINYTVQFNCTKVWVITASAPLFLNMPYSSLVPRPSHHVIDQKLDSGKA